MRRDSGLRATPDMSGVQADGDAESPTSEGGTRGADRRRAAPRPVGDAGSVNGNGRLAAGLVALIQVPVHITDERDLLRTSASICAAALGPGVAVSVVVGPPAAPTMMVTSSLLAQDIDGAQMAAEEGPGPTAWATRHAVSVDDLRRNDRWPRLALRAASLPPVGVVSVPLLAADEAEGVLNAYRPTGLSTTSDFALTTHLLGSAVAAMLNQSRLRRDAERRESHARLALRSRPVIDMAKGMIMAYRGCGADEAFRLLVRASQESNVKLKDVAAQLVADVSSGKRLHLG